MELKLCLTCAELLQEAYQVIKLQKQDHARDQCDHCGKRRYVNRYEVRKIEGKSAVQNSPDTGYGL